MKKSSSACGRSCRITWRTAELNKIRFQPAPIKTKAPIRLPLRKGLLLLLLLILLLGACRRQPEVDLPLEDPATATLTPTPEIPTPTSPPPPTELVVCLRSEPASLYLYGATGRETDIILEALYDGPYDLIDHQVLPVILQRIPSLENGDARLEQVLIKDGDLYLNPVTRQPDFLAPGSLYQPADCESRDCLRTYYSGEVAAARLVVDFHLMEGILWSDGVPLTANDSVYSFSLDAQLATPTLKYLHDRTASYTALGAGSVRWSGIPGFMDREYMTNFWSPLPEHILGSYRASELLEAPEAARTPLGWGPYAIDTWNPGLSIQLSRNENYFRAAEGLPAFDLLIFRFLSSAESDAALQQILTGECDLVDEAFFDVAAIPQTLALADAGELGVVWTSGMVVERLDFAITRATREKPRIFSERATRAGIAACINRQRIIDEVFGGLAIVAQSYLPPTHPLYRTPDNPIAYDPAAAIATLRSVGWIDLDNDLSTPLVSIGTPGLRDGTPLAFTYLTTPGKMQEVVAQRIAQDLAGCGVQVDVRVEASGSIFAPWPDGEIFGRSFDTVGWGWPVVLTPPCEMFSANQIPGTDQPFGINASGFNSADYDQACERLLLTPGGSNADLETAAATQRILAEQLPAIPLFVRPRLAAHAADLCGLAPNASAMTLIWNLESFYRAEECQP